MAENNTNTPETVTNNTPAEQPVNTETAENKPEDAAAANNDELAKAKMDLARMKAALDRATKEAGDAKKALRAKQSADEVAEEEKRAAEEEKRAADEERDRKLAEYEKRFVVADTAKKVLAIINDEAIANNIADGIYGSDNVELVINSIRKLVSKITADLKAEYGKIPAPGVGSTTGVAMTKDEIFSIKDPVKRQRAIADNLNLFG